MDAKLIEIALVARGRPCGIPAEAEHLVRIERGSAADSRSLQSAVHEELHFTGSLHPRHGDVGP